MEESGAYDNNGGQRPEYSGFERLNPSNREIRVLQLENRTSTENLRYIIHHKDLRCSPEYCALSYCWGAPVPEAAMKKITIHEESVFITPTLYSFLETLAAHDSRMCIWVDAICINQRNVEERNHQISMMRDIFKTAQRVYAWLGRGDDDTNYAMEHIRGPIPQTRFNQHTFSSCAEKLFRCSYWTRRWVIQEFALAQELFVVCGAQVTSWGILTGKIGDRVLDGDIFRIFRNFEEVKLIGLQRNESLLELMLKFRESRCIDQRDRAFALRGIARDGERLLPDYNESITDVFFRVLSQLPMEKVLPKMTGYRWPHQAASQLQRCLQVTKEVDFKSLVGKTSDLLYTVFEYTGTISAVHEALQQEQHKLCPDNIFSSFSIEVRLQGFHSGILYGNGDLKPGDMVYSLQSTPRSPKGFYIAFRRNLEDPTLVGMLINQANREAVSYWMKIHIYPETMKFIGRISLYGILRCSRNIAARRPKSRVLCHINRLMLILLWLLDLRQAHHLWVHREEVPKELFETNLLCGCPSDKNASSSVAVECQEGKGSGIEILPSLHSLENEGFWAASDTNLWSIAGQDGSQEEHQITEIQSWDPRPLDFYCHGRTELSYAAGDGHVSFTRFLLSGNASEIKVPKNSGRTHLQRAVGESFEQELLMASDEVNPDPRDSDYRTPLWWAASEGQEKVLKLLLATDKVNPDPEDIEGLTPLWWAAKKGHEKVVELLLATGKVDLNPEDRGGRTPLLWAARKGHEKVVELLLATDKINPDSKDRYGRTPLWWAASEGHERMVELLLAMGKANPDLEDIDGWTPLLWAASGGHEKIVELLLATDKVNPTSDDGDGRTPLSWAASEGHEKVVKLLLDTNKVNPDSEDRWGLTPLSWAVRKGHEQVVKLLQSRRPRR